MAQNVAPDPKVQQSSPKPKPAVAARQSNPLAGGGPRLTPLGLDMRSGITGSGTSSAPPSGAAKLSDILPGGGPRLKPVVKERLTESLPGGSLFR